MNEGELRELISAVKASRVSRRAFVHKMVGLGLTAPFATQLLAHAGLAQTAPSTEYKPTKAGGGGALKLLFWQAATLLNPHFAVGTKDAEGCRIFYEPLAAWDPEGNLVPVLAAEIPDIENGGVAADGLSVTWKLKKGVEWHDGRPFTADDVVFNWEYASDPATAATTIGDYRDAKVEKIDPLTVRVRFEKPSPFWAGIFVAAGGMIIPKHLFEPYKGANSRDAPANFKPVGTGPYRFVEFKPGDLVKGERNPSYHVASRPYFDTIEMKGGGDAVSAARAVIQTGEYDYAWNMQVEDEILLRLENAGNARGRAEIVQSRAMEHIQINFADPWTEVDGERSSPKTKHALLSDPAVRQALRLLVDRASVEKYIYGRTGVATGNFLNNPERFVSKNTKWEFNVDKANQLLEEAGWKRGSDGIRTKDGKKLKLVFQTSINAPRQKTQAIVKQACQKAGIDIELKSVTPSVYFSSDVANPDTARKFYSDIQMYTIGSPSVPDPERFMQQFVSWEIASKDNKWQGSNPTRWRNEEYDKIFRAAQNELDPVKRAALFIKMND
ncbi:MAG: peptide ABC transporter substrate-binding protein, partial [Stellaceae bacterium]